MTTKVNNRMIDGETLNILDFGAIGDGVTDNTTAFQTAFSKLSENSTLYIPDGIYNLAPGTVLKTTGDGQNIVGSSKNKAILVFGTIHLAHSVCSVQSLRMYGTDTYGILVDDDRTEAERQASYSTRARSWISDVDIGNKTYGIALTDTGFFTRITGSHLSGNETGIWLANDQSVTTPLFNASWDRGDTFISDCTIASNSQYGIYAKNHGTALISNNKIIGNGINFYANPDRSGGRDERVMQMFMSNNSLENATSVRNVNIISVADNGSGRTRYTTDVPHQLPQSHVYRGDISGTTNYDGEVKTFYISPTVFDTEQSFVANETGTLSLGGWDLFVEPGESGSCAYWNLTGGDINQYNIETGANFNIHNVNVKYQRRYGSGIDSFSDVGLINGTDRTSTNAAINIFPSGDFNDGDLFTHHIQLDGMQRLSSGLFIAKKEVDATGVNQKPIIPDLDGNVFSGSYIPSQVGSNSNVANVIHATGAYTRVGNTVSVSGSFDIIPSTAGDTYTALRFNLPVASDIADSATLSGTAVCSSVAYAGDISAAIQGDNGNNCAFLSFKTPTTDQLKFRYTLSYRVLS